MLKIFVIMLAILLMQIRIDIGNAFAQETSSKTSKYVRPSLPKGFIPEYADRQAYTSQKIQRLLQNPKYFKDRPNEIVEVFAYLELMIDEITRPNNHQVGKAMRLRYMDMRKNIRSKIGLDESLDPSVVISVLYAVSKMNLEAFKTGVVKDDMATILKKQGLNKNEILSLIAVFDEAGFDAKNVVSVGDTINEIVNAAGIDSGVAEAIVDALGLEASTSFSDAVAAYNAAFGTSLSVGQAREALGLDDDQDVGNSN